ncbi:MAG: dCMP deaminase family protein [Cytophagales bacterium]|nr:dCMP deaminase family protein [Cytophagales bacterium]
MSLSLDSVFMELAVSLASKSHCVRKHVGAVIVSEGRVISTGYNGPPSGSHNCDQTDPNLCLRGDRERCFWGLHAEANAILFALKNGLSLKGTTLYVTLSPCLDCARMIYLAEIKRVLYLHSYKDFKQTLEDEGLTFLRHFKIVVEQYKEKMKFISDDLI